MSSGTILIVIGGLILLIGISKVARGSGAGFNLRNIGINIGSTNTQNIRDIGQERKKGPDWVGLGIAAVGLLTAIVGLFAG